MCLRLILPLFHYLFSNPLTTPLSLSVTLFLQPQTHGITTGGVCVPCHCNSFGSKSFDCDETGQCRCQPGVSGPKCDRCSRGFFNFQEGGCTRKHRQWSRKGRCFFKKWANITQQNKSIAQSTGNPPEKSKHVDLSCIHTIIYNESNVSSRKTLSLLNCWPVLFFFLI